MPAILHSTSAGRLAIVVDMLQTRTKQDCRNEVALVDVQVVLRTRNYRVGCGGVSNNHPHKPNCTAYLTQPLASHIFTSTYQPQLFKGPPCSLMRTTS